MGFPTNTLNFQVFYQISNAYRGPSIFVRLHYMDKDYFLSTLQDSEMFYLLNHNILHHINEAIY